MKHKKLSSYLVFIALILTLSLGLFACNKDNASKYAYTLIVGSTMQIDTLNRLDADGGSPGYNYDILAASLTQLTPVYISNGSISPNLCTYSNENNGLLWKFDVKDGYTWHDGTAVSEADLLYTFEKVFDAGTDYESATVADGKVVVTLSVANPRFLNSLATVRIYPKHIFENATAETLTDEQSVIGCGPFKFSNRNIDNNTITFVKNDAYPKASEITFNTVIVKFYDTADVMHLALKSGEIDMEYNYSSGITADAEKDFLDESNITLQSYAAKKMTKVLFFNNAKITLNANVKKAIQKAIDYSKIRASFGSSTSTASREGFISPAIYGYNATEELTRDLNNAKALLTSEGYSTTNKLAFELLVRSDNNDSQYAQLLKTALEETGMITVTLNSKATADWQAYYKAGNHDACLGTITVAGFDMQAGLGTKYFLSKDNEVITENPVCYANCALRDGNNQLTAFGEIYFDLANATNDAEYVAAAKDFQDYIVENTPAISLLNDTIAQAYSKKLSGFIVDDTFGLFSTNTFLTLRKTL